MCELTEEKIKEIQGRLDTIVCKAKVLEVTFTAAEQVPEFVKADSTFYGGLVKISKEIGHEVGEIYEII